MHVGHNEIHILDRFWAIGTIDEVAAQFLPYTVEVGERRASAFPWSDPPHPLHLFQWQDEISLLYTPSWLIFLKDDTGA